MREHELVEDEEAEDLRAERTKLRLLLDDRSALLAKLKVVAGNASDFKRVCVSSSWWVINDVERVSVVLVNRRSRFKLNFISNRR